MNQPSISADLIKANLERIRKRITAACQRAGRSPESVCLIAAAKTFPAARVAEALDCGVTHIAENYVQEAQEKFQVLGRKATWHLIGHLQRNKAGRAVEIFDWVQSLDSLRLAEALSRHAVAKEKTVKALVEVNLAAETTKTGVREGEVEQLIRAASRLDCLGICGLMCIPPLAEDPEQTRPYFRRLALLKDRISQLGIEGVALTELSMGMSADFEVAIEEGATMVRLGTAIFGARNF